MPNKTYASRDRRTCRLVPSKDGAKKPAWLKCVLHKIHNSGSPHALKDFNPHFNESLTKPSSKDPQSKRNIKASRSQCGNVCHLLVLKIDPQRLACLIAGGQNSTDPPPSSPTENSSPATAPPQLPTKTTTRTFDQLPNELKTLIFCKSPDIQTVRALAATSTTHREVYRLNERKILTDILCRDPRIFREAVAVHKAAKLDYESPFKEEDIERHVKCYKTGVFDEITAKELSLEDLRKIADLQENIHFLANEYCRSKLSRHPVHKIAEEYLVPSSSELKRLYLAFYMLQHFSYLFKHLPDLYGSRDLSKFLSIYPAYEVEFLTCVKEYLYERLEEILTSVREKLWDYETGKWQAAIMRAINPCYRGQYPLHKGPLHAKDMNRVLKFYEYRDGAKSTRLTQGFSYLRRLFTSDIDTAMELLVINNALPRSDFFSNGLEEDPYTLLNKPDVQEAFVHRDNDSEGPAGWLWANGGKFEPRYSRPDTKEIRDWGYPFWDEDRLEKWGILQMDSSRYYNDDLNDLPEVVWRRTYHRHWERCQRIDDDPPESSAFDGGGTTAPTDTYDAVDDMDWSSDPDGSWDSEIEDAYTPYITTDPRYTLQSPPPSPGFNKRKFCDEEEEEAPSSLSQPASEEQERRKTRRLDRLGGRTLVGARGGDAESLERKADDSPSTPEQESDVKTTQEAGLPGEDRYDCRHRRWREHGDSLREAQEHYERVLAEQDSGLAPGDREKALYLFEMIQDMQQEKEAEGRLMVCSETYALGYE